MRRRAMTGIIITALLALSGNSTALHYQYPSKTQPSSHQNINTQTIDRVSTVIPFPRGLAVRRENDDSEGIYVLARGRVRSAGGVSAAVKDRAGTIFRIDPDIHEPWVASRTVGIAVRENGKIFAIPHEKVFHLWDRNSNPPQRDRWTDRPYCTLRWHEPTKSFYLCAFSGIDMPKRDNALSFSKNLTDAVLRFDTRTEKWYEVERHDQQAGGNYPQNDPRYTDPPHGWLNGPDNCLPVGNRLYVAAKDNSLLVEYDLTALQNNPDAGFPESKVVMTNRVFLTTGNNQGKMTSLYGQSALACDGNQWLYIGYRTSGVIIRVPLDNEGKIIEPVRAQLIARFDPYNPITHKSANVTDMCFDDKTQSLFIVSAKPARVYKFKPDPSAIRDARTESNNSMQPWDDLATLTRNPKMKCENILVYKGFLYITSGDGYDYQQGAAGTVWRINIDPYLSEDSGL